MEPQPLQDFLSLRFQSSGHNCRGAARRQPLPGHRVDRSGRGDRHLLLLPGVQVVEDHGVVQEHGPAVRPRPQVNEY